MDLTAALALVERLRGENDDLKAEARSLKVQAVGGWGACLCAPGDEI